MNPADKKSIRRVILSQRKIVHAHRSSDADQYLADAIVHCIEHMSTPYGEVSLGQPCDATHKHNCFKDMVIAAYIPILSEANIWLALDAIIKKGGRIALPCVDQPHSPMVWREWSLEQELVSDPIGLNIRQPSDKAVVVSSCALTHILVPVVAVDQHGSRIGYGGGYYDRTIEKMMEERRRAQIKYQPWLIGVSYREQFLIDKTLGEPHDIRVHCLVTHHEIIPFSKPEITL